MLLVNDTGETVTKFDFKMVLSKCVLQDHFKFAGIDTQNNLIFGDVLNNSVIMKKINFEEDYSDVKWSLDGQNILVTSSNKLHLVNFGKHETLFTHTCSRKNSSITAFTNHPKRSIFLCADDKKSLQIFQNSQSGNHA